MKIAVTGASGFIGRELLGVLSKRNDIDVVALTRNVAENAESDSCEWRCTDYSFESLKELLEDIDVVIHLAGVRGTENDASKFTVNVKMTETLLRTMAVRSAKRIVFASTVSVYDDESLIPWTEEAPLKGRTAYGDSKICAENLIKSYSERYGFTFAIARIAQVLGEGEKRRGMMNTFIDTARDRGKLRVMGKSIARRQYIYVKDLAVVLAILATGEASAKIDREINGKNTIINVGMPHAYTNLEIAQIVNEAFDNPTAIDYDDSYPETGRAFCMDIARLREELGYEPLDMKEALVDMGENKHLKIIRAKY